MSMPSGADYLAELREQTEHLERRLMEARLGLEREMGWQVPGPRMPDETETATLLLRGRHPAARRRRFPKVSASRALIALAGAIILSVILVQCVGGSASWPASVYRVQAWVTTACQNPDVRSEPGQVNFACGQTTRQILWVFALLTSGNNPNFGDATTNRKGLEPITIAQGDQVSWSLNLHHPYNPASPVDSIEVAARAINNIVGGATVASSTGTPVVQPGLEGSPANCLRYTGSSALRSRAGYPPLCATRLTPAGQLALVEDVYQKWVPGASPQAAQDAAVLFENASNPGSAQAQAIIQALRG